MRELHKKFERSSKCKTYAAKEEQMTTQPFKVLIVGCGNIAGGFDVRHPDEDLPFGHAKAYLQHGGFTLAACVEPDTLKRTAFQQRWGVTHAVDSLSALTDAPGFFDVISVCSTTSSHAADLEAALRLRPKLIFCEKPVTSTLTQTQHWVRRCEEQGISLAVNYSRRWAPDVSRLRDELNCGRWGEIRCVVGLYNKGILNNGSHMIDLLHYLLGSLRIEAVGEAVYDFFKDDPSVPVTLRSEQGIPITLNMANAADYAHFELQLVTAKGVITMEDGGASWRIRQVTTNTVFEGYRTLDQGYIVPGEIASAMTGAVNNIYQSLTQGSALASTGSTAMQAQQLCEQIKAVALGINSSTLHSQQAVS